MCFSAPTASSTDASPRRTRSSSSRTFAGSMGSPARVLACARRQRRSRDRTALVPLPFAPLVGIALGALFAWLARSELARSDQPLPTTRPFVLVTAFAGVVFAPAVGYFVAFHGDWAWLYLVP